MLFDWRGFCGVYALALAMLQPNLDLPRINLVVLKAALREPVNGRH
jgi:hypothetical protein